ncbi:glycosyltransferase WbuB [Pullulanibacillus camelliae]|uniref:Glycosyltransferase WbuB n=1 Tax=Pullulanibacillus camelliae TaxID=1707096 RepID=A0A8J2YNI2_9BACL|nr:glycosyltransferase family 4 protein [Pullulanibacillus camelliae]GGE54716.1 glycosyltransferase WbuB [Pullulanibacillus camelliae]
MKHLLMITQNYYPEIGSAANRMKNLRQLLKEDQYEVTVLTTEPCYPNRQIYEEESAFWSMTGSQNDVIRVSPFFKRYMSNMLLRLLHFLDIMFKMLAMLFHIKKPVDVILVTSPPLFMGIVGLFAKRVFKAPVILDIRDLWPDSFTGVGVLNYKPILFAARGLEKHLYKKADRIIVNSPSFKTHIQSKRIPESRIAFLPNALTEEELMLSSKPVERKDDITVIYTGNLGLAQDIEKLLCIAEQLKEETAITFKIIGYGYKRKIIEKHIVSRGLSNIQLLEPKTREETLLEVHKADIAYVTLVDKDVFDTVLPGKVMDYMCLSKPIIGDVSGYCAEVINDSQCGLVSEKRSVDDLCEHILYLIEHPELRASYGNNGYRYAYKHLRWKTNIKVLEDILEGFYEKEGLHVRMESLYK